MNKKQVNLPDIEEDPDHLVVLGTKAYYTPIGSELKVIKRDDKVLGWRLIFRNK